MRPVAILLVALLVAAPACGRRKKPPPAAPQPAPNVEQPRPNPIPAPKEVPAELKGLVQKEWDSIAREGAAFEKSFQAAQIAKDNNDRAAMDVAIETANEHYKIASDAWAEIAYWPDNAEADGRIDEATAEVCRKWLAEKNATVTGWTKKNKGLKEFSRADSSGK
jgi:hypothetical protein